jgi:hypothetical protein
MDNPYKRFNSSIKEFIRDLINTFPEYNQFKMLLMAYKFTKTLSKKHPQIFFKQIIIDKHRDDIICKNFDMFDHLYIDNNIPAIIKNLIFSFKDIKFLMSKISQENKEAIMKHLQVLVVLSDRCDNDL